MFFTTSLSPPPRLLKISVSLLLALLLVLAFTTLLLTRHAGSLLEQELATWLLAKHKRLLTLEGKTHLQLWPQIRLELPPMQISEPGQTTPFLRIERANLHLDWPTAFLENQLIPIEQLDIEGLQLTLSRDEQGRLNIDDLLQPNTPETPNTPKPVFRHLSLHQARIHWRDAKNPDEIHLENLELRCHNLAAPQQGDCQLSGQIQRGGKTPLNARFTLEARHDLHADQQRYVLQDMRATLLDPKQVQLDLSTGKLEAHLASNPGIPTTLKAEKLAFHLQKLPADVDRPFKLSLFTPETTLNGKELAAPRITLDATIQTSSLNLLGQAKTPLKLDLSSGALQLSPFKAQLELTHPRLKPAPLPVSLEGHLTGKLTPLEAEAQIWGQFPGSPFKGQLRYHEHPQPSMLELDLAIDQLDVGPILRPEIEAGSQAPRAPSPKHEAQQSSFGIQARLHFGLLKFSGITARKFDLDWKP